MLYIMLLIPISDIIEKINKDISEIESKICEMKNIKPSKQLKEEKYKVKLRYNLEISKLSKDYYAKLISQIGYKDVELSLLDYQEIFKNKV